jgi:hypothetical protein
MLQVLLQCQSGRRGEDGRGNKGYIFEGRRGDVNQVSRGRVGMTQAERKEGAVRVLREGEKGGWSGLLKGSRDCKGKESLEGLLRLEKKVIQMQAQNK